MNQLSRCKAAVYYNVVMTQVNYYVNGNATTLGVGNEMIIDLGFDCSEAFHEYRFSWTPLDIK